MLVVKNISCIMLPLSYGCKIGGLLLVYLCLVSGYFKRHGVHLNANEDKTLKRWLFHYSNVYIN